MFQDPYLLSLIDLYSRHIWCGNSPPTPMTKVDLFESTNFRVSPIHHGAYQVAWIHEKPLSSLKQGQWPIVLDEAIRLLGSKGILVIRFHETKVLTIINLKHFLGRRYGIHVALASEQCIDGEFTIAFAIERHNIELYKSKRWSFIVLAQGDRMQNVLAFFESIRKNDPNYEHEIIVVGPEYPEYTPYRVRYVTQQYRENLKEICRKKNDAAAIAQHENLLIIHDRYVLNPDFFTGFESYGYDFDFLTVKSYFETGEEYPSYCALLLPGLVHSRLVHCTNYQTLYPTHFINGGFIIIKTQTLRAIGFNNLCFWGQGEDVEIAHTLMNHSVIPRVNYMSSATTVGINPSCTVHLLKDSYIRLNLNHELNVKGPRGFLLPWLSRISSKMPPGFQKFLKGSVAKKGVFYKIKRRFFN